jgi:hypothetical protein
LGGGGGVDVAISAPCCENISVAPNGTQEEMKQVHENLCGKISKEENR